MADETRVQVLKEPGRSAESQSFMWLYRTGEDGLPVILLYGYTPTRSGDNAADFLDGFRGYLETDGYQGYNKVSGIKRCSCWAHIRRYFVDAIPKGKQLDYNQPAVQECITATAWQDWKAAFPVSAERIMKKETNASREGKTGSRGLLDVG